MGKDKNAPKRPMSVYMLYCNSKRAMVDKKHPNLKMTEKAGILAKLWNNATAGDKKKFEGQNKQSKAKYAKVLAKYQKTPEYAAFQDKGKVIALLKEVCKKHKMTAPRGKKTKFPSDPNAPKRSLSGFFLWANENRPALLKKKKNDVAAVGKALGAGWQSLGSDVKAKFQAKAEKGKAVYQKKLNAYKKTSKFTKYDAARTEFNKMKKKL